VAHIQPQQDNRVVKDETLAAKLEELAGVKGITTREALFYIMRRLWGTEPFSQQVEEGGGEVRRT